MAAPKGNKFAIGNTGGRPRLVEKEDLPAFGLEMEEWARNKFEKLLAEKNKEAKMPFFLKTFAYEYGLSEDTLKNYREANREFFVSYIKVREIVAQMLMIGGLKGWWHPTAYIFTAKNETDMRDRIDTDITSGGKPIDFLKAIQIVDEISDSKTASRSV